MWSLELHGSTFDDGILCDAPGFPKLEILELDGAVLRGPGLRGLAGVPKLRCFRARLGSSQTLSFGELPRLAKLEVLSFRLPPEVVGIQHLCDAVSCLKECQLGSDSNTRSDGELALPRVEHLTLAFPKPPAWVKLPAALQWLTLEGREITDDDTRRVLRNCPDELDSLGVRGTRVSDALLVDLNRFRRLKYLDAADTNITVAALRRFAATRSHFKCYPTLG